MTMHKAEPRIHLALGAAIVLFLVAATVPYSWLIANFGYDDILREPAAVILRNFRQGGAPLIMAWFGFAMASLLFIPVARGFQRLLAGTDNMPFVLGTASAVAQAIGLLRWVLVVPGLAAVYAGPHSTEAAREAAVVVFDAVHHYGGMVIGEMVGQLLLAGWTAMTGWRLFRPRAVPRWLAAAGLLTLPFWLLGQTELIHQVVPAVPSIEVIPIAFMAWEAWLAALAIYFLASGWRRRGTGPSNAVAPHAPAVVAAT